MSFWKKIFAGIVVAAAAQVSVADYVYLNNGVLTLEDYVHAGQMQIGDVIQGSLSKSGGGLTLFGDGTAPSGDLEIKWQVVFKAASDGWTQNYYEYTYEVYNPTGRGDGSLSHLSLEVSDGFKADEYTIINANGGTGTISGDPTNGDLAVQDGNSGFYAVEFLKIEPESGTWTDENSNPYTFVIQTIRAPMWGDVLLKDGTWDYVNAGHMQLRSADNTRWLLTPNSGPGPGDVGGGGVPTPAAVLLAFPLFAMLGISRPRRQVH